MKPIRLFLEQHTKKLGRKWYALPLLLLFPVIMIGLLALIAVTFLSQEEAEAIQVGLVDHDESEETEMVGDMLGETDQLGSLLEITPVSEPEAEKRIEQDEMASYIVFPDGFTDDLYHGNQVTFTLVGNPEQSMNTYMVKELLDSVSRHIRGAQANILTINEYAQELPMTGDTREQFLLNQFKDFLLNTLSRGQMMQEHDVTNEATQSPAHYYTLAGWFVTLTIWLLGFYSFFTDEQAARMRQRMRLYGVRDIQAIAVKIVSTFIVSSLFAAGVLWLFQTFDIFELYKEDVGRIFGLMGLYSLSYLVGLALIETVVYMPKIRLLVQSCFTFAVLLVSGAIVPVLYYPSYIQDLLPYSFSTQAFRWMKEIVLNDRFYADMVPLGMLAGIGVMLLLFASWLKERVET